MVKLIMAHRVKVIRKDPTALIDCLQCGDPLNGEWRIHNRCIRARIRAIAAENRNKRP